MTEITLFDSAGSAVAYISNDGEGTIYLWSGEAVAYLKQEHIYGFNGAHLGWFDAGIARDPKGFAVGFIRNTCPKLTKLEPLKKIKKIKKIKSIAKIAPIKPINKSGSSALPLLVFLQAGAK
ncbi:4-fold beta flower protein [Aeromonas sp. QDB09]|uniref:4-fold beta flower protein n=1 Tax=Aeromonas sp. QDB09 TaxID=2989837 RepID=UPI0022E27C31|nr:hypothetical protein [Aeromonas sp. QDB09]